MNQQRTEAKNAKRRIVPPVWFAALFSVVGIVGMRLVYGALTHGSLVQGVIGGVLLIVGVVIVGTPLAAAQYVRKVSRQQAMKQRAS